MDKLQYAAICRGYTVLVSYQDEQSAENAERYLTDFLCTLSTEVDAKTSFSGGSFNFHLQISSGTVFACGASPSAGVRLPFMFLNELCQKFQDTSLPARAYNAEEHEFDREFKHVLKETLDSFNKNVNDPIEAARNEARVVTGIMQDNMNRVLQRGENLDTLANRTGELESQSITFRAQSNRVRRKMWLQNLKYWIIIGVVLSIVIILIVLSATGKI